MLVAQISHVLICCFMGYGILFSKTPLQAYIVLANLVVVFLGLRLFKGCMLTQHEEGERTSRIGKVFMLENPDSVSTHNFEEIAVGFGLLLQLARTLLLTLKLDNVVF
uniref:Uncharacterized protein n=1 Tax=viral metagenome TaxID=1070528 RepID=A0A6C0KYY7_9ZZZZ